jgi:hypothetical protein
MDRLEKVRKAYFDYMTYTTDRVAENYNPSDHMIAKAAIRRYRAIMDLDYKVLWEESEWLIYNATQRIVEQDKKIAKLKREIENMKTYHGIPK